MPYIKRVLSVMDLIEYKGSTPQENNVLLYTAGAWILTTLKLSVNLDDCSITDPVNNQYLKYNSTAEKWLNAT